MSLLFGSSIANSASFFLSIRYRLDDESSPKYFVSVVHSISVSGVQQNDSGAIEVRFDFDLLLEVDDDLLKTKIAI